METLRDFYRGRRVFVTGHTGFKGAWLAAWLRDAGAQVTGYALAPERDRQNVFVLANLAGGTRSVIGDVRDRRSLESALRAAEPEVVFHLAAQSLVRRSYADPMTTLETNVIGTAQLLDVLRGLPATRAVVVVTSDKCYENAEAETAYREDDPLGGRDPYSASKGCQEIVAASFRRSFLAPNGVAVATARAGNVIGGGDWSEDRLVADLMLAAAGSRVAVIRNPDSVRPWQHVMEPLRGYLMLGRALHEHGGEYAEAWNFGPDASDALSVRELAERMAVAWPQVRTHIAVDPQSPHEARMLRLDNTKAREGLGWVPVLSIDETVTLTVDWYRAVHGDASVASDMLLQQWREYERRVAGVGQLA